MPDFRPPGASVYCAQVTNPNPTRGRTWDFNEIEFTSSHDRDVGCCCEPCWNNFFYLDVGAWIHETKTFGIAYGDPQNCEWGYVILCDYQEQGFISEDFCRRRGITQDPVGDTMIRFLTACNGRIRRLYPVYGLNTQNRIFVFLGDLHLPVATRANRSFPPEDRLPPARVRAQFSFSECLVHTLPIAVLHRGLLEQAGRDAVGLVNDSNWLTLYESSDIFGNVASSLNNFIGRLEAWSASQERCPHRRRLRIHLVQVGDLYEMWIGLQRLFHEDRGNQIVLGIPGNDAMTNLETFDPPLSRISDYTPSYLRTTARSMVIDWMRRIDRATMVEHPRGQTISLTGRLFTANMEKTFMVGNHDCYVRPLTDPGGQFASYARPKVIYNPAQDNQAPINQQTDVPRVYTKLFRYGMHIEHGHENDRYNIPSEVSGWEITQLAFVNRDIRGIQGGLYQLCEAYDPLISEREQHMKYSIVKFLTNRREGRHMNIFVMAHTHSPFLTKISFRLR